MKLAWFSILIVLLLFSFPETSISQSPAGGNPDDETSEETGGVYPTESQGEDSNDITPDRSDFGDFEDIPSPGFTQELHISSQTQNEIRPNYFVMEGYVDLSYQGYRLQADRAEYDADAKKLIATGNVVLDQQGQRITGEKIEMNLEDATGTMHNVFGYVPPQIFFWGERLDKIGEDEYKLYNGVVTECSQLVPHWQVKTSTSKITVNEYAHFTHFTLKVKKIPVLYSPYMLWPIKRDRATGFLFPGFGPNSNKGFWLGGSFFWAMGRSMDSTYWVDHWALRGWGGGAEYRYASGEKSGGSSRFYYTDDRVLGPQWTLNADVKQELPSDWRVAAIADVFSSFEYIRDYDNSFAGAARRQQRAQGFLTRNWSYYSFNLLGDFSETQQRQNEIQLYHLPEVEFQSRSQKLGPTPFFWTLLSSFSHLGRVDQTPNTEVSLTFQRYDGFPTISYPITYLSWLTVTPTYGHRFTYYSKRQTLVGNTPVVEDEGLLRDNMDFTLDLRGPNFAKIFDTPNMGYSKKWKHAIEPQVTYKYISDIEELANVLAIDELDRVIGLNTVTYSITNLLYAKRPVQVPAEYDPDEYQYYNPKPLEPPIESAWEFVSWRLSQTYHFQSNLFPTDLNPNLKPFFPIESVLRVSPSANYNIDFRTNYDVNVKQISEVSIGSTLRSAGSWYANVSYTLRKNVLQVVSTNQIRSNGGFGLWKNRVVVNGEIDYDIKDKQLFHNALGVLYNDDCFTIGVQWKRFDFGDENFRRNENQVTFSVSLPNIGNLVNFSSGAPAKRF